MTRVQDTCVTDHWQRTCVVEADVSCLLYPVRLRRGKREHFHGYESNDATGSTLTGGLRDGTAAG